MISRRTPPRWGQSGKMDSSGTVSRLRTCVKQRQLRQFAWLAHANPGWLTPARPEHALMMARMFWRIIGEEARNE